MKELIVFDLDNTLVPSKTVMDDEMSEIFSNLLSKVKVAVMSGGSLKQFKLEFISKLKPDTNFSNLLLFPTDGTAFYRWSIDLKDWEKVYQDSLGIDEKNSIFNALDIALKKVNFDRSRLIGNLTEDKGSAITFSALGQDAPLEMKEVWDRDQTKRIEIKKILDPLLPDFEVNIAGTTSIDITRKGYNKAYGIKKMVEYTGIPESGIMYIGDSLFDGGNDSPVKTTGVETVSVSGPEETKVIIKDIIKKYD
jgi:HAD superfamily hydrolase (TIGR01484 family)